MNSDVISALIGAGATIGSVVAAFLLNQLAKHISDKRFRVKHDIRDISGTWETKWIFIDEEGEENITECTHDIKMKGKDRVEGEGKSDKKKWHYSLTGTIDGMGYLSGTWRSLIDGNKGSFLLQLRPSFRTIEGHVLSTAYKTDTKTRSGKWIWEVKER